MTREEAKEYASFLNAFAEGKEVQHAFKDKWVPFDEQDIDNIFDYLLPFVRIKLEPKYRPYTEKELFDKIMDGLFVDTGIKVLAVGKNQVFLDPTIMYPQPYRYSLLAFMENFTEDGKPCGVEVTE